MPGFNLPPGCSVRDIPGNRPEDDEAEAMFDAVSDILGVPGENDEVVEKLVTLVTTAQREGFAQGQASAAEAYEYRESEMFQVLLLANFAFGFGSSASPVQQQHAANKLSEACARWRDRYPEATVLVASATGQDDQEGEDQ